MVQSNVTLFLALFWMWLRRVFGGFYYILCSYLCTFSQIVTVDFFKVYYIQDLSHIFRIASRFIAIFLPIV